MAVFGTASIWAKIALVLVVIALILQIVGIATHYWMQLETNTESVAFSVGLWKAQNCSGSSGSSCDTIDIPNAYTNDSLKATQAFQIIIMIFIFIVLVVMTTYVATERFREMPIAIFIVVMSFVTVTCGVVSMIVWLAQLPDTFYPGYSFGVAITATILMFFVGLLMIPDVRQYSSRRRPNVMQVKPEGYRMSKFSEARYQTPPNRKFASMQNDTQVRHYHNPNREPYIRSPPPTYRTAINDSYPTKHSYGRDARSDVQTPDYCLGRVSTKTRRY